MPVTSETESGVVFHVLQGFFSLTIGDEASLKHSLERKTIKLTKKEILSLAPPGGSGCTVYRRSLGIDFYVYSRNGLEKNYIPKRMMMC